jgi:hypothetical protein
MPRQWQSNPSLCDYQKTLTRSCVPYPTAPNGCVKQSWTDSNRKNCYPIDILMNNCKTGELLGENIVVISPDYAHYSLFASSTLYFIHYFGIHQYISLKNWHIPQRNFAPEFSPFPSFFPPNVADWQVYLKIYIPAVFTIFLLLKSK